MSSLKLAKTHFSKAVFVLLTTLFLGATATASEGSFFVDLLILKEGKTTADANVYFTKIEPVVRKHGLRRIVPGLNIVKNMKGTLNADLVNIWFVTNPETTFKNIFSDPEYLKHVALRNMTFDMDNANMVMLQPF